MLLKLGPAGPELDIISLLGWPPRTFLIPEVTLWDFLDLEDMTKCHFWTYSGIWMSRVDLEEGMSFCHIQLGISSWKGIRGKYDKLSGSESGPKLDWIGWNT